MVRFIYLTLLCLSFPFNNFACINEYATTLKGQSMLKDGGLGGVHLINRPSRKALFREKDTLIQRYRRTGDLKYFSDYGVKLIQLGHFQRSKRIFLFIEKQQPGLYATAANLGTTYELLGQNDSALVWIRKSIKINSDSHEGSEWIHERILLFKLGKIKPVNGSILGLDFGSDDKPHNKQRYPLKKLVKQIYYQLHERLYFVKPPDAAVAHLYFDYANIIAQIHYVESALPNYHMASAYGMKTPEYLSPALSTCCL